MTENPFHYPSFIRTGGVLGTPILLGSQVCTRKEPGNIPIVAYDNAQSYASGNGAIIENIIFAPMVATSKSTLLMFIKIDGATTWSYYDEFDLPAVTMTAADKPATPSRLVPTRKIFRISESGNFPNAIRIPGSSRDFQIGFALGAALNVGASGDAVLYLEGGEY